MARVGIVFPPLRVSRDFIDYPYFADLGAIQLAAVLRDAGHAIALVDALASPGATLTSWGEAGELALGTSLAAVEGALPRELDAIVVALTPFHRPPSRDPLLGDLLRALRAERPGVPARIGRVGSGRFVPV